MAAAATGGAGRPPAMLGDYRGAAESPEMRPASRGFGMRKKKKTEKGALKNVMKLFSNTLGVENDSVPPQILRQDILRLNRWSVQVDDDALEIVAEENYARIEAAASRHRTMAGSRGFDFGAFAARHNEDPEARRGLEVLEIHGAERISDLGLKGIADTCPNLRVLDIGGCLQITDLSLRAVGISCPSLRELNIDRLTRLTGAGLGGIADTCKGLTSLSMQELPQLDEWVLQRIGAGCMRLRALNLARCTKITDHSLKYFTNQVTGLTDLNLAHCKHVSDVGLLSLSHNCPLLERLILTRQELPFKVTDVGLLALSERCPGLTELDLSGSECVTDVGISWLSGGCHGLKIVNLNGCNKVTDVGILAISEGCPVLENLSIASLKKVTDIGVRHLSRGCPRLQLLDVTGLFLITDGKVRDFGLEGLQALAQTCGNLRTLNLTGCFQVAEVALRALGRGCTSLTAISLAGCHRVDARGVAYLTKGCPDLKNLSFRTCERVDDNVLWQVGRNSHRLTTLNLVGCDAITDYGVSAVAKGCRGLQTLNVAGCKKVTDLSLLALAEAKMTPGLAVLNMGGCTDVSDTGVSWLAERCTSLLSLNLKGCSVSKTGLKALTQTWSYVTIRRDAGWVGVWPKPRAKDLRWIDEYGAAWKAAMHIQGLYRGKLARRAAARAREQRLRNWACRRMQSLYRGRQARKQAVLLKMQRRKEIEYATKLQCRWRQRQARGDLSRRRAAHYEMLMNRSARKMQAIWRGKKVRDLAKAAMAAMLDYRRRCEEAAIRVQQIWRGKKGREFFRVTMAAQILLRKQQHESAERLQTMYRARLGRREANRRKAEKRRFENEKERAARFIQSRIRGHQGRRQAQRRVYELQLREQAALYIQTRWRSRGGRLSAHLKRRAIAMDREHRAALRVQTAWRARQGRYSTHLLKLARAERAELENKMAMRLQRIYRGHKGRREYQSKRQAQTMAQLKLTDLQQWAALTVQRYWRGKIGRRRYQEMLDEHRRRWKVLYDDEQQRPFYYDQTTGDIRWRKPQELLDAMPKPKCENCEYYDAIFECGDCHEYYCEECWTAVHFGGKRKGHKFRAMYDVYGKRVDYGEGEWPSKWPSEIEQDEFVGWRPANVGAVYESGKGQIMPSDAEKAALAAEEAQAYTTALVTSRSGGGDYGTGFGDGYGELGADGWAKYYDDATGLDYYFNATTGVTTHDRPTTFATPRPAAGQAALEAGEAGWNRYHDEASGKEFYYNEDTGASTWRRPYGFATPRPAAGQAALESGDNNWAKYWDEAAERDFYYNEVTGESVYERPHNYYTPRPTTGNSAALVPADGQAALETGGDGGVWKRYHDDEAGMDFYYNEVTGESTYDRPPDFVTPRPTTGDATQVGYTPDGSRWLQLMDAESSQRYFFNEETGESTFEKPEGFVVDTTFDDGGSGPSARSSGSENSTEDGSEESDEESGEEDSEDGDVGEDNGEAKGREDSPTSLEEKKGGHGHEYEDDGVHDLDDLARRASQAVAASAVVGDPKVTQRLQEVSDKLADDDSKLDVGDDTPHDWKDNRDWTTDGITAWLTTFVTTDAERKLQTPPLAAKERKRLVKVCKTMGLVTSSQHVGLSKDKIVTIAKV